ncbi:glycosyltransferase involved in cell wall biosynthesis [Mariniflexile fucanivorans]|uniref:Glycosyltransferase involved in cell wall biosynthesis n=1 Tax=Mariniflexile fucanivorans TaxID=264023 RepID=A0A4R1RF15_9FLAO|nr:glycosyltransferase [Mariniflexile fucanivorans]TCL64486.1 glycosyltransferase involved in cell wall biosynthesis [Mariniflexile fucanivorans]
MAKKILIIGFVWPEPKSSAAGSRMMQLIYFFQSKEYQITFASPCAKSENAFNLNSIGVNQVTIELNHSSFDVFIKELNPHIVLFDRFMMEEQFGWRVTEQCPDAMRIIDTEDLHCLRKGRLQAFKDGKPFDNSYLFNDIAKREIASIYRSDLSLIISEAEMNILKNDFKVPDDLLVYLPFLLETIPEATIQKLPKFEERNHFVTIGNFLHEPNYNAVLYLKETIWPLIRKQIPKAELHIYGAYASQKVNQLHNEKEGFLIKGFADDVNEVMQHAKVCLAPIRFGAGLKGKLVDAMLNGTPCVTTSMGAEGMFGNLDANGFIENNPEDFTNKVVQLYENENLWNEKQKNGFQIINNRFNKVEFQKKLALILEETTEQLQNKRLNNFTAQMLQHHSMQSTKFMSKWIEEKNKTD